MGIFFCTLSLLGCNQKPVTPNEELTSISISQSHMDRTHCYSFSARKENNLYLLDVDCMIVDYDNNECNEINFTDKEISEEDFQHFKRLDEKYDFISLLKSQKEKKSKIFALDETVSCFSVKYGMDAFPLYANGDCYREVLAHFFALAEKYSNSIQ